VVIPTEDMTEEERLQVLEDKTEDAKLQKMIKSSIQECLENGKDDTNSDPTVPSVLAERRLKKVEREITSVQTDLADIQQETLTLARRALNVTRTVDKLEKEVVDIGYKIETIDKGTIELKNKANETAKTLKDLATNTANELKALAKDTAQDLKDDNTLNWNRKQQLAVLILSGLSIAIAAIALIRGF
jgi:predicted RNase H-like nuclease (RuvC/YqgF family)